jgi:hypothetical protein
MRKRSPDGENRSPVRRGSRRARFAAPAALAMALAGGDARAESIDIDQDEGVITRGGAPVREASALLKLARHPDREVRLRLAGWLPDAIEWMSRVERTELISSWAVSPEPAVRLAIARALRYTAPALGSHSAIEHLARDRDPAVRLVIAEAAWLRRREAPDRLIAVLALLADDTDRMVREVARLALGDT